MTEARRPTSMIAATTCALVAIVCWSAACSLVDPLDGISDGKATSSSTSSSSSSASSGSSSSGSASSTSSGSSSTTTSSSSSGGVILECDNALEQEPNEQAVTLDYKSLAFCGSVSASDEDKFTITTPINPNYTLTVKPGIEAKVRVDSISGGYTTTNALSLSQTVSGGDTGPIEIRIHTDQTTPQRYDFQLTVR